MLRLAKTQAYAGGIELNQLSSTVETAVNTYAAYLVTASGKKFSSGMAQKRVGDMLTG